MISGTDKGYFSKIKTISSNKDVPQGRGPKESICNVDMISKPRRGTKPGISQHQPLSGGLIFSEKNF
jgi:hypothetical protein